MKPLSRRAILIAQAWFWVSIIITVASAIVVLATFIGLSEVYSLGVVIGLIITAIGAAHAAIYSLCIWPTWFVLTWNGRRWEGYEHLNKYQQYMIEDGRGARVACHLIVIGSIISWLTSLIVGV